MSPFWQIPSFSPQPLPFPFHQFLFCVQPDLIQTAAGTVFRDNILATLVSMPFLFLANSNSHTIRLLFSPFFHLRHLINPALSFSLGVFDVGIYSLLPVTPYHPTSVFLLYLFIGFSTWIHWKTGRENNRCSVLSAGLHLAVLVLRRFPPEQVGMNTWTPFFCPPGLPENLFEFVYQ